MKKERKIAKNKKCRIMKWMQDKKRKQQRMTAMKKPKFWELFAKYIAVGLCVAVLIGYAGGKMAGAYYSAVKESEFDAYTDRVGEDIAKAYSQCVKMAVTEEKLGSLWEAQVRNRLNWGEMYGYEACLYEVSTKDRVVEQKDVANITLAENPGSEDVVFHVFECEWNELQEALEDYRELMGENEEEYWKEEREEWANLKIEEVYIKGGTFLPGKMQLVMENRTGVTEVIREYDYTPENTDGYQYVEWIPNDIYGISDIYLNMKSNYTFIDAYMESEEYEWNEKNFWSGDEVWNRPAYWGTEKFFTEPVTLENGEKYVLVVATDINLWNDYKERILAAYGVLFLLTLLAVLVIAYHNYMKRLSYYQLDSYRRETTNAMAHDLKTPLMAISGCAENLRNNVHSEKKEYYADLIVEHVTYMNDMVEQILELAKVERINHLSEKTLLDLGELTETILNKYEVFITDKSLSVKVEGACQIKADKACMNQALENLIGNAMKYAPQETEILIRMSADGYEIRNCMGYELQIPAGQLCKPFVKGEESRNEQRGTGVGLTIVKNITDMHGFELCLQCEQQEFAAEILF